MAEIRLSWSASSTSWTLFFATMGLICPAVAFASDGAVFEVLDTSVWAPGWTKLSLRRVG